MVLANTYHLALRPGAEVVSSLGGLHAFMGWEGPILTDSGGFQIFSLAERAAIGEEGARFRSHIDGRPISLTPEEAIQIQEDLGSDVAMVLDHVIPLPATRETARDAMERSTRWAARCKAAQRRTDQALFGIVQGGTDRALRVRSAEELQRIGFPGYAIGGLSVGEPHETMVAVLDFTLPVLPEDRPRYLMGVGSPRDLLEGIARGVDLFDCVMPTRNGRNALAFTDAGPMRLRNRKYATDRRPLEPACCCLACGHSRGYLRHLFMSGEMLGPILLSIHNLTYYQRLVASARDAIAGDRWGAFYRDKLAGWLQR
jgi:queuine tRNA-ribosyltransferase